MTILVGVDGGGTHTRALAVSADGRRVGEGRAGPANHQVVGIEAAVRSVALAVRAATGGRRPDACGLCLAGLDLPEHTALLQDALSGTVGGRLHLENDVAAALWAAPGRAVGVVASGTGAAVALRLGGRVERLLALSAVTGPVGGAGDIATLALRSAILAAQGAAPPTRLTDAILAAFGLPDYLALARATEEQRLPAWQVALVAAPLCARLAAEGDQTALWVLRRMGSELGRTAGRFFTAHGLPPGTPVARYGALLQDGPRPYRDAFGRALRRQYAAGPQPQGCLAAVAGAVLFAAEREAVPLDPLRRALSTARS